MNKWLSCAFRYQNFVNKSVEDIWMLFHDILLEAVNKFVPLVKTGGHRYPKWYNKQVKSVRKAKAKMWKRFQSTGTYNDYVEYKLIRNKATAEYRRAKVLFETKLAKEIKNNPKAFYAYVHSKSKLKDGVGALKDHSNLLTDDRGKKCVLLNNFFTSVFANEGDE